jgi:hypothetical protein
MFGTSPILGGPSRSPPTDTGNKNITNGANQVILSSFLPDPTRKSKNRFRLHVFRRFILLNLKKSPIQRINER